MRIRHLTSADNLDPEGLLIDPLLVRHGLVVAGRVAELAGPIDPLTHLNLDFAEHRLAECLVAERLEVGAHVVLEADRFLLAYPRRDAFARLGAVDVGARRAAWQALR